MNYVYMLEGQLKYETIEYDDLLTFELYNKYGPIEDSNESGFDLNLVYYLQSEIDMSISLDAKNNKINLSMPEDVVVLLSNKDGLTRESESKSQIEITEDLTKFDLPNIGFSFLLNTKEEPESEISIVEKEQVDLNKILFEIKKKIKYIIPVFLGVIVLLMYLTKSGVQTKNVIFFDNQSDLMKANLYSLNASEIFVKSELKQMIQKLLDEIGIKYVRFELQEKENKVNLMLYIFEKKNDDLEKMIGFSQILWLKDVVFHALDPKNMYEDFNLIAEKYELGKENIFNRNLTHKLVSINMKNNNLKYDSMQRDIKTFREKWGRNYIEFNLNLIQEKEMPFDFIITNGDQRVIKTKNGFYFN